MLLSHEWLLKDGAEAPEGSTVMECRYCGSKFAVPAGTEKVVNVCDDPACADAYDKEVGSAVSKMMTSPDEASEAIKKALGN